MGNEIDRWPSLPELAMVVAPAAARIGEGCPSCYSYENRKTGKPWLLT